MHVQTQTHCELLTSEKSHRCDQSFIYEQKKKPWGVSQGHASNGGAKKSEAGYAAWATVQTGANEFLND